MHPKSAANALHTRRVRGDIVANTKEQSNRLRCPQLCMRRLLISSLVVLIAGGLWVWRSFRIPLLKQPCVFAQNERTWQSGLPAAFDPDQTPPSKEPPFAGMGIQERWKHSDLVCTGIAEKPVETGAVETIGGSDRNQVASWVTLEKCFKGRPPAGQVKVLGDSVVAQKEITMGFAYAGPPIGFVTKGRNLLFLRKTDDPEVWRVTIPVYAACISLAETAPDYELDDSKDSIRHALVKEFEAVIEQGRINAAGGTLFATSDEVAALYLPYIWELLGRVQGTREFKLLMASSSGSLRPEIAMELLRQGDQAGEPDTIARLLDATAVVWKRTNAAYALRNSTSSRAREALEEIVNGPGPVELRHVAEESLSQMNR